MTYLLDTNIISYLLKGNKTVLQKIDQLAERDEKVLIPSVSYYEIRRGLIASGATTKMVRFLNFVEEMEIAELTIPVLDQAALIYADLSKSGNLIEDADIFIGATALENDAVLVTGNEKHFERIKGLKMEVWR